MYSTYAKEIVQRLNQAGFMEEEEEKEEEEEEEEGSTPPPKWHAHTWPLPFCFAAGTPPLGVVPEWSPASPWPKAGEFF